MHPHPTPNAATPRTSRRLERLVAGQPTSDGAGVRLTRVLTADLQQRLDPFLMLDHFASERPGDYIGGFPDHPHRGFETVTYMLAGRMRHRDSAGNQGLLQGGGVQWMTAGRGVIHSEMPEQDQGLMEGFQLWLNLPARDKMRPPWYRDIPSAEITEHHWTAPGGRACVRLIAGPLDLDGTPLTGSVQRPRTEPLLLDVHLPAGAPVWIALPATAHAFVYPYRGHLWLGPGHGSGDRVPARHMGILSQPSDSAGVWLCADAAGGTDIPGTRPGPVRALLVAGQPLREPIAQYGPFVMNTREQLIEAVDDFHSGRLVQPA